MTSLRCPIVSNKRTSAFQQQRQRNDVMKSKMAARRKFKSRNIYFTYCPLCLCGTQGSNEIFPTLSIFSQFFSGAPAVIELPWSLFYSSVPSCFWAPSAPFAVRCPAHCNSGYVVIALPQHMPDASPSSPGDEGMNILLLGLLQSSSLDIFWGEMILRIFLRPAVWKDPSLERS